MAPPELQLINQIWNGSRSKAGCIAWFGAGNGAWGVWAERRNLESSAPEICEGDMNAACTHTAFCVAKLLSAKSSDDGIICFDLDWSDGPKDPIAAGQLESLFLQVDKVFLVKVDLADGMSHSFVVTSYASPSQVVCCGLYMSYATAAGGGKYTLPEFLKGNLKFAPKPDKDISMIQLQNVGRFECPGTVRALNPVRSNYIYNYLALQYGFSVQLSRGLPSSG